MLKKYLEKTIRYADDRSGRVIITFVVEKDGTLSNIKILRGLNDLADKETIRVMKLSPKWKSGFNQGKKVRTQYTIPVRFN